MRSLPLRRAAIVLALAAVAVMASSTTAFAGSVHFKKPLPTFSKDASSFAVTASGINLSGLGNGDIKIDISATGSATALCQNPGGSSKVPGQNPVAVNVSGTVFLPGNAIKNGSVLGVTATTAGVPTPTHERCGLRELELERRGHDRVVHVGESDDLAGRQRQRRVLRPGERAGGAHPDVQRLAVAHTG
jgi:hypothetical protein